MALLRMALEFMPASRAAAELAPASFRREERLASPAVYFIESTLAVGATESASGIGGWDFEPRSALGIPAAISEDLRRMRSKV
jgi:hypothetical protein